MRKMKKNNMENKKMVPVKTIVKGLLDDGLAFMKIANVLTVRKLDNSPTLNAVVSSSNNIPDGITFDIWEDENFLAGKKHEVSLQISGNGERRVFLDGNLIPEKGFAGEHTSLYNKKREVMALCEKAEWGDYRIFETMEELEKYIEKSELSPNIALDVTEDPKYIFDILDLEKNKDFDFSCWDVEGVPCFVIE